MTSPLSPQLHRQLEQIALGSWPSEVSPELIAGGFVKIVRGRGMLGRSVERAVVTQKGRQRIAQAEELRKMEE